MQKIFIYMPIRIFFLGVNVLGSCGFNDADISQKFPNNKDEGWKMDSKEVIAGNVQNVSTDA